tara:strand:+ start:20665 stop:21225 length:561 start_codon:yes stop_codon:yes gene_type:complete
MKILILIFINLISYSSLAQTENQKFVILSKIDGIEIREYSPAIYASVTIEENKQNSTFRILAGYIFGGNKENQKISMTAPVHMEKNIIEGKESLTMKFVMPSKYKVEDLAEPNDSRIKISESKKKKFAAIRFSGYSNDEKINNFSKKLKNFLISNNISFVNNLIYLGYDPPYKFWGRKNEVLFEIN